jgi:hypothetical protein
MDFPFRRAPTAAVFAHLEHALAAPAGRARFGIEPGTEPFRLALKLPEPVLAGT